MLFPCSQGHWYLIISVTGTLSRCQIAMIPWGIFQSVMEQQSGELMDLELNQHFATSIMLSSGANSWLWNRWTYIAWVLIDARGPVTIDLFTNTKYLNQLLAQGWIRNYIRINGWDVFAYRHRHSINLVYLDMVFLFTFVWSIVHIWGNVCSEVSLCSYMLVNLCLSNNPSSCLIIPNLR